MLEDSRCLGSFQKSAEDVTCGGVFALPREPRVSEPDARVERRTARAGKIQKSGALKFNGLRRRIGRPCNLCGAIF
jgi:hypothetical protein